MEDKIKIIISLCIGIIFGFILSGFFRYQMVFHISGEQFGSVAEWLSGIGSSGAVIFSLCITLLRRKKVKVTYRMTGTIIRSQKKVDLNSVFVTFLAFNQTDIPVGLKFYGF